jgi:hypothetical protein
LLCISIKNSLLSIRIDTLCSEIQNYPYFVASKFCIFSGYTYFSSYLTIKTSIDTASSAISPNFDRLPENVRNQLLLNLADKIDDDKYAAHVVARAVSLHFRQCKN